MKKLRITLLVLMSIGLTCSLTSLILEILMFIGVI